MQMIDAKANPVSGSSGPTGRLEVARSGSVAAPRPEPSLAADDRGGGGPDRPACDLARALFEVRRVLFDAGWIEIPAYPQRLPSVNHHPDFVARWFSGRPFAGFVVQSVSGQLPVLDIETGRATVVVGGLVVGQEWRRRQAELLALLTGAERRAPVDGDRGSAGAGPRMVWPVDLVARPLHEPVLGFGGIGWVIRWAGLSVARIWLISKIFNEPTPQPVWQCAVRADVLAAVRRGGCDPRTLTWGDSAVGEWQALALPSPPPPVRDAAAFLADRQARFKQILGEADRAVAERRWSEAWRSVIDGQQILLEVAGLEVLGDGFIGRGQQHLRGVLKRLVPLLPRVASVSSPAKGGRQARSQVSR